MPGSPIDRSFGSPTILTCDGERHRELRKAIDPKYRPAEVERLHRGSGRADRRAAARRRSSGTRRADLMAELLRAGLGAQPRRGARALRRRAETLRRWFAALADGATNFERDAEKQASAVMPRRAEIDERLGPVLDRLEREPDDSTISHMIHAGGTHGEPRAGGVHADAQGDPARRHAGAGPRRRLGSVRAALTHPERWPRCAPTSTGCCRRRSRRGCAGSPRSAPRAGGPTSEVELGGVALPADAPVAAVIASANRDRRPLPGSRPLRHPSLRAARSRRSASAATSAPGTPSRAPRSGSRCGELLERHARTMSSAAEPEFTGWEFRAPREPAASASR